MSELAPMVGKAKQVTIGGKPYTVSPLTIDDLAEFEVFVKTERNKTISESLKQAGIKEELIAQKIVESSAKPIGIDEIDGAMRTISGVRYLLWFGLKKNHPELKQNKMGDLVTLANFEEASLIVAEMGGKAVEKKGKNVKRGK